MGWIELGRHAFRDSNSWAFFSALVKSEVEWDGRGFCLSVLGDWVGGLSMGLGLGLGAGMGMSMRFPLSYASFVEFSIEEVMFLLCLGFV